MPPALRCGLAGNAKPGADLCPGVSIDVETLDCLSDGGVDLLGEVVHEDQGLHVAVSDTAAVGAPDAADERRRTNTGSDLGFNPWSG